MNQQPNKGQVSKQGTSVPRGVWGCVGGLVEAFWSPELAALQTPTSGLYGGSVMTAWLIKSLAIGD